MRQRIAHGALALITAASLLISPVYAQEQSTPPSPPSAPPTQEQAPVQAAPAGTSPNVTRKVELGPDYQHGPKTFPNLLAGYREPSVPLPMLTNTPRIDQLIENGKLMLSLDDAISIALENNLDIYVQRFTPWIAETQLLKAKAGGIPQGGSSAAVILGSGPAGSFDPVFTSTFNWSRATLPVNNALLAGTGTSSGGVGSSGSGVHEVPFLVSYSLNANFGFSQTFHEGTTVQASFNNNRGSTTSPEDLFNPFVQSTVTFTVSQPLLNGFGFLPNTRFIIEAKNSVKVAEAVLAQQVITSATAVANAYWELVFDRENVKVQQAALAVSTKLYEDNKKQLEIGTMAPLDVLTAESELATDTQNLILAQTTKLQQETVLLNLITKNLVAPELVNIEIVPTTPIANPDVTENLPLQDAVTEAWKNRPELQQADLNLLNAGIEVRATRNALLPQLNAFGQYSSTSLAGVRQVFTPDGTFSADPGEPIVDTNGTIVVPNTFVGVPNGTPGTAHTGIGDALSQVVGSDFPTYAVGVNLVVPIRNRSAQADSARALLNERQQRVQYKQLQNSIVLNVRNAQIALQQDRAQVAAAEKAQTLAAQTLDAEQKKYQLGSSTSYNVVLRSRDLTTAQGNLLRARVNLEEAAVNFNQAMGRTLDVFHIIVAGGKKVYHEPLIPGTPEPLNGNQ